MGKQKDRHKEADELKKVFQEKRKHQKKILKIVGISCVFVLVVIVSVIAYGIFAPGKYDGFAKCLAEKGVVMQGEDWCQYTQAQKSMFGKSFKYINYEQKPDLEVRPTWIIDGKTYEKVQSFDRLSALTGCEY